MGNIFKAIGKLFKKVSESEVGQIAEGLVVDKVGNLLQNALQDVKAKDPDLAQQIVKTLAAWLPYLADTARKTGTDIDDKLVQEIEEEIVAFDNTPGPAETSDTSDNGNNG